MASPMFEWHLEGRIHFHSKIPQGIWRASETGRHTLIFEKPPARMKQHLITCRVAHLCTLYVKLVLFSISSLFRRGAGAAQRGGCVAGVLPEIGLPLSIIVNIIPADRQAGRREATRGGAFSAKTHPLKPKLFLIYMFRLFKTVTSTTPPLPPPPPASFALHLHTCCCLHHATQRDYFFPFFQCKE